METKIITGLNQLPKILQLNEGGEPVNWIDYEECAKFYNKNKVLWSMGEYKVMLRGGINAVTGERSTFTMDTIVAIKGKYSPKRFRRGTPPVTNSNLFVRDHNLCGYCGNSFNKGELTRDHVTPKSKGGLDTWTNLVTSCMPCNHKKGARTPSEANMPLLYVPYTPNYNEHLILANRRILFDQMEYLLAGVSKSSRIHEMIKNGVFKFTH